MKTTLFYLKSNENSARMPLAPTRAVESMMDALGLTE
jgi:hypothetical protein